MKYTKNGCSVPWTPPPGHLSVKNNEKDDPTISCSHLTLELSDLAGRKINLKGGGKRVKKTVSMYVCMILK